MVSPLVRQVKKCNDLLTGVHNNYNYTKIKNLNGE